MMQAPVENGFTWVQADGKSLAEAFTATHADTRPQTPDWSDFAQNVAERFADWMGEATRPFATILGPNVGRALEWIVLLLALILLCVAGVRLIRHFSGRMQTLKLEPIRNARLMPERSAEHYRRALLSSLAAGETRQALTAMWWWFAAGALEKKPADSMTTYDVLALSGRSDLRSHAQTLDRLRFKEEPPPEAAVRQLLSAFEAAL